MTISNKPTERNNKRRRRWDEAMNTETTQVVDKRSLILITTGSRQVIDEIENLCVCVCVCVCVWKQSVN